MVLAFPSPADEWLNADLRLRGLDASGESRSKYVPEVQKAWSGSHGRVQELVEGDTPTTTRHGVRLCMN
jgi:hypothetical protein